MSGPQLFLAVDVSRIIMMMLLSLLAVVLIGGAGFLRWWRVAQREHYLAGSVTTFAWRWWTLNPRNIALLVVGLATPIFFRFFDLAIVVPVVVLLVAPLGLSIKGTTSPLAWTPRLRRVAIVSGTLWMGLLYLGVAYPVILVPALFGIPLIVDAALALLRPVELWLGRKWVEDAQSKLRSVAPTVVAITGSYGKTTTKAFVLALLSPHRQTVASPASFNNRMGLARAINEHLAPGTDLFVAEMGTYGPGEIRDLCAWIPPKVAVITAIGPVHLERFGSLDVTLSSKAEIFEQADVCVLNIDDERLSALAVELTGKTVITCSATGQAATVSLSPSDAGFFVRIDGEVVTEIDPVAMPSNLACAIGVAVALDVPLDRLAATVAASQAPAHRQAVFRGDGGFEIIDDTYNSNPAGVRSALGTLSTLGDGKRVVVTPGMVELGKLQYEENREFGTLASQVASHVLIVGHTNRKALLEGTKEGPASVILMPSRPEAVAWVKANLGTGDAVLYENDLPDHYA